MQLMLQFHRASTLSSFWRRTSHRSVYQRHRGLVNLPKQVRERRLVRVWSASPSTFKDSRTLRMEEILEPSFWNSDTEARSKLGEEVVAIETTPGRVDQQNCKVLPLGLRLGNGDVRYVVAKVINLAKEDFENDSHFQRTYDSYRVEVAFYKSLSNVLRQSGAMVADHVLIQWNAELGSALIVLEDLRCKPTSQLNEMTGRSMDQKLALDLEQAKQALEWLAKFHACFWRLEAVKNEELPDLWSEGSYWSLEKRLSDVDIMEQEWSKVIKNFSNDYPEEFSSQGVLNLGSRLRSMANGLDAKLKADPSCVTLVHGDFKTANIFFSDTQVSVCDFQWTGPGAGVKDVVYLLWSSVDPQVVEKNEEALLDHYYVHLMHQLSLKNGAGSEYSKDYFSDQVGIAFLDYVRFLIGRMWGPITPDNCVQRATSINQGIHKRCSDHLVHMVTKADQLLNQMESVSSLKSGVGTQPVKTGRHLLSSLLALCVVLSEQAGAKVREVLKTSGERVEFHEKNGDGPQTEADLSSERLIMSGLSQAFPDLTVIGEEGVSGVAEEVIEIGASSLSEVDMLISSELGSESGWDMIEMKDLTIWVDPLDGTKEFLDGNLDAVTVLVGIAHKGSPIAGVVHQPFFSSGAKMGRTWWGGPECGVFCNQSKFEISDEIGDAETECIVATTRSHPSPAVEEAAMILNPDKVLAIGGLGNKMVLLLTHQITHYVFPIGGTKRWDTCAPQAILNGLGGKLVNRYGQEYDYGAKCNPNNKDGVMATLTQESWRRLCLAFRWTC